MRSEGGGAGREKLHSKLKPLARPGCALARARNVLIDSLAPGEAAVAWMPPGDRAFTRAPAPVGGHPVHMRGEVEQPIVHTLDLDPGCPDDGKILLAERSL